MPRTIGTAVLWVFASMLLAAPRVAFACAACTGRSDDAMAQGLNAAVLTLLALLLLVLGSVVGSVTYLIRRTVKHPLAPPSVPVGVAQ